MIKKLKKEGKRKVISLILIFFLINFASAIIEENSLYEKLILEGGVINKDIIGKFFVNLVEKLNNLFENNFLDIINKNPDISHPSIQILASYIISLLEPFCILSLLILGFYLIFLSGTPLGRATAKSLIPGLIIAILVIPFSLQILFILFSISEALTNEILLLSPTNNPVEVFNYTTYYLLEKFLNFNNNFLSTFLSLPFLFLIFLFLTLPILLFVMRHLILTFLSIIFPITIFLYLFIPTRIFGKRLFELTISWIFIQVIVAIMLVLTSGFFLMLPPEISSEMKAFMGIAAILTLLTVTFGLVSVFKDYLPEKI